MMCSFIRASKVAQTLLLFVFIFLVTLPVAQAQQSIAVVDFTAIEQKSLAAQNIQKQLSTIRESYQKEFDKHEKELMAHQREFGETSKNISAEEFRDKRRQYEEKLLETKRLYEQRRKALDQAMAQSLRELHGIILDVVAQIAEEKKYDVVLRRESVVLTDKTLDVTDMVMNRLNEMVKEIKLEVKE